MEIFKLPDLGEGLPDAEIHEWFVQEGQHVNLDQPLVSMETAKAVVEVPSPQEGIIAKIYGQPGDVIKTGEPLVAFQSELIRADQGTVVGQLEENHAPSSDDFIIGSSTTPRAKATPTVRMLAKKYSIDINAIQGSGEYGLVTREDVQRVIDAKHRMEPGFEPLHGVRRAMLTRMEQSHREVVPVSIFDEADIEHWPANEDITVRLIRAISAACKAEPALNAWFDSSHAARKCFDELHLGLAIDHEEGLFVPVIHDVNNKDDHQLRQIINEYKQAVAARTLSQDDLKGATLTLSNFGKFAGRFASPIITVPTVAILAVGRLHQGLIANAQGNITTHRLLPLSLSFDHRAVTGGEATRFLGTIKARLES